MKGVSGGRSVTWSRSGPKGSFHVCPPPRKCVQSPRVRGHSCRLALCPLSRGLGEARDPPS